MTHFHNRALAFVGARAAVAEGASGARFVDEKEAAALLLEGAMVCSRFGLPRVRGAKVADVMELWAFIYPAQHCVPSVRSLAKFLGQPLPPDADACAHAAFILKSAAMMLERVGEIPGLEAGAIVETMTGWAWRDAVRDALPESHQARSQDLRLFHQALGYLPRWSIPKGEKKPAADARGTGADAAAELLQSVGMAEQRSGQIDYMNQVLELFDSQQPCVMLAQADTGIGKTLGYLIPAYLTAKQKGESVWVITFTRALQTQIARECARLPEHKVAVRKGRENYLCLLNFEQALEAKRQPILAGLVARWAKASVDGDIRSGDFPSWLAQGSEQSQWLGATTDSRENCIHNACPHYRSCFVERQRIEAMDADIVIANHALVMSNALFSQGEKEPLHYIFDEGHHIFSAADSAFSYRLSGQSMARMRFWLLGTSGGSGSPAREQGLRSRISNLFDAQPQLLPLLQLVEDKAKFLPNTGWRDRVQGGLALCVSENFLSEVNQQVVAAQTKKDEGYDLESEPTPLPSAGALKNDFESLRAELEKLLTALRVLDDNQLTSVIFVLGGWVENMLPIFIKMCDCVLSGSALAQWVDRFVVERIESRAWDYGMVRNALDPGSAFAENILADAKSSLITSASLRPLRGLDKIQNKEQNKWVEWHAGANHLAHPPRHIAVPSPFDYGALAKMLVVTDIAPATHAKGAAMAELFCAAGGGGLGLWTSIRRMKEAHSVIAKRLAQDDLRLLSQHQGQLAPSALIDIFREDENACLIGTDALRDGIDVPGAALRLLVFDRMPWARPDILHKKRRALFASGFYDDMIVSMRLQQAFGRLIRKKDDRGIFVLLDSRFPSKLENIFPKDLAIVRLTQREAVEEVKKFYER